MAFGALIPAAGLSSRMGRFKPLLPLGGSTFLDQLLHTMRAAGVGPVVIVTGWHAEEIEAHLAGQPEVFLVHNPDYARTQMFDSIRQGLPLLQGRCSRFLVAPADVPLPLPDTLRRLLEHPAPFARPVYGGRRGHPAALDAHLIEPLLAAPPGLSLKTALARAGVLPADLPVEDEAVLLDADTPEDYGLLLSYLARREYTARPLWPQLRLQLWGEQPLFDEEMVRFLELVEACGSMQHACKGMHISYTTAWRRIAAAERTLGFALLERESGGAQGGGSRLTEEGRTLLHRCSAMQRELRACCDRIFEKYFSDYTLPVQD